MLRVGQMMEKILVSACLLGHKVRYDGNCQLLVNDVLDKWQKQGRLLTLCPEVEGGLPVPRPPAEIVQLEHKVLTEEGSDVTAEFSLGAQKALAFCQLHNIRYALLKESSPSCGSTMIYDGSFSGTKILGAGITSQLLQANSINVYSENNISELIALIDGQC